MTPGVTRVRLGDSGVGGLVVDVMDGGAALLVEFPDGDRRKMARSGCAEFHTERAPRGVVSGSDLGAEALELATKGLTRSQIARQLHLTEKQTKRLIERHREAMRDAAALGTSRRAG